MGFFSGIVRSRRVPLAIACAMPLLVIARAIYAAPVYNFTTLDDPMASLAAGYGTVATGISGGSVVGYYYASSGSYTQGFLFNGGNYATLNDPAAGATGTEALGVSGNTIVGDYTDSSNAVHGFIYNGSTYTTLNYPGASNTFATGVDGQTIVGYYENAVGTRHGFIYNGSIFISFDSPEANFHGTTVGGVSGSDVVGYYSDTNGFAHGFLFDGTNTTVLTDPSEEETYALGISGSTIVGYIDDIEEGDTDHGFVYNGSTFMQVDDPSGIGTSYLEGISNGILVGTYSGSLGVFHGFIATPIPEPSFLGFTCLGALTIRRTRRAKIYH